jgi:hypothetical protein
MIRPMPGGLLTMRPGSNAGRFPATFRMSFRRSVSYDALPIVLRTPSASKRILCGEDQTSSDSLVPSLWGQQPNGNSAALNRCAVESEWCESVQRFGLLDEHTEAVKMVQRPGDSMYGGVGDLVGVGLSVVTSKRGTGLDRKAVAFASLACQMSICWKSRPSCSAAASSSSGVAARVADGNSSSISLTRQKGKPAATRKASELADLRHPSYFGPTCSALSVNGSIDLYADPYQSG